MASNIELSFPGAAAPPAFSVRHFDIAEGLSVPFEAVLVAASPDPDLDFDLLLGRPARCHASFVATLSIPSREAFDPLPTNFSFRRSRISCNSPLSPNCPWSTGKTTSHA